MESGPVNFISNGIFNQTNANFEVVFHPFPGNYAACSVFIDSLNFSGGTFKVLIVILPMAKQFQ